MEGEEVKKHLGKIGDSEGEERTFPASALNKGDHLRALLCGAVTGVVSSPPPPRECVGDGPRFAASATCTRGVTEVMVS